jgi:hypothetical protein
MKIVEVRFQHEALLIKALAEVETFCRTTPGSNIPVWWFLAKIMDCYFKQDGSMLFFVVLDDAEKIVGHFLGFIENHYGTKVAFCYQGHLFPDGDSADRRAIVRESLERWNAWGKANDCTVRRAGTIRNLAAFERLFRVKSILTIVEAPIT